MADVAYQIDERDGIAIRHLPSGVYVACKAGAERIGPAVETEAEIYAQVEAFVGGSDQQDVVEGSGDGPSAAQGPAADSTYSIESSYGWHRVIGPDGEQVGQAYRTLADAEAAIEELG